VEITQFKDALFAKGAQMGFTDMELYYQSTETMEANLFKGELDNYSIAVNGGVAFRGRYSGKMGYAYTELIDGASIDMLLQGARGGAEINDSQDLQPIFAGSEAYATGSFASDALDRVTSEEKIAFLKAVEAECFRLDPRVASIQYCVLESSASERHLANTFGVNLRERTNGVGIFLWVLVKDGESLKDGQKGFFTRDFLSLDPHKVAAEAVEEALSSIGAAPVDSKAYPVLLRNTAAADLLATFAGIFSATNVQKGRSLLKGKVGQAIAAPVVTLIDDPFLPNGAFSQTFDAEGVATRRLAVIEHGILKSLFHNLKSAAIDQVAPTGHGHKASYKGAVSIAPTNLFVQPGTRSLHELVESLDEGLVITQLEGLHSGANPISGDFSLAANGFYVQGGRIRRPVNQITVAGNFYELLNSVEEVGSDLEFGMPRNGYFGSPTLLIKSLAVTGK
jgi:PmbA protein